MLIYCNGLSTGGGREREREREGKGERSKRGGRRNEEGEMKRKNGSNAYV